ncbi:MAG: LytTR family DNA-binding domain-containing protein [Bacteroidota bacterium]|nr:LytTR family DNA-binding domain-containing protein [Bacteroidota bacterium]
MKCMIIDDDEMSRNAMKHLVMQVSTLTLTDVCANPMEALNILNTKKVDLIFLDIEMPGISGPQLIKSLKNPPLVILATSKKEYALESYEWNVVDYLIKPLSLDRFAKAVSKAKEIFDAPKQPLYFSNNHFIFIKTNGTLVKLDLTNIRWIEALGDYINIITPEKKYTVHGTLKALGAKLQSEKFVRVHRSYIVATDHIDSIDEDMIVIDKQLIPIGAVYKENLIKHLNLL